MSLSLVQYQAYNRLTLKLPAATLNSNKVCKQIHS